MDVNLTSIIRGEVLQSGDVRRQDLPRLGGRIPEEHEDAIYFVESGYIKSIRTGRDGRQVIVGIAGPGELLCTHPSAGTNQGASIEVLQDAIVYRIPQLTFLSYCEKYPQLWKLLWESSLNRQAKLEDKISMLCLEDVAYRLLYYLGELAQVFRLQPNPDEEYSIPISQSELASYVGATRETTSTTLNVLARQGLLRLERRLVIVKSLRALREALQRYATAGVSGRSAASADGNS